MKFSPFWFVGCFGIVAALATAFGATGALDVPYPDGYRRWTHVCSAVMRPDPATTDKKLPDRNAAPHGLILHVYANDQAMKGYDSGHFPEGSVLVADWFFLEDKGSSLVPSTRKSVNVMVRDARFVDTGGWGFEDFDRDSHTIRNVKTNALTACYVCHGHAEETEHVFSKFKP